MPSRRILGGRPGGIAWTATGDGNLPPMRHGDPRPVAVLSSDWHLSDRPPLIRSAEPDWYVAMARPLSQVRNLCHQHNVPLLHSGDLFDRWNPSPALIAFAMRELPEEVHAVPGQHDLRHHRLDSLPDTAFGVLVEALRINYLKPGLEYVCSRSGMTLHGFPWNTELVPCPERHQLDTSLHVALVHKYVWWQDHCHAGADKADRVDRGLLKQAKGYDAIVVGDNHMGFLYRREGVPQVLNCGGLMRRKSDELDYHPSVGLLWSDGHIDRVFLDTSEDKFITDISPGIDFLRGEELEQLIADLKGASDDPLDFRDSLRRALKKLKCPQGVREMVLKSVGE